MDRQQDTKILILTASFGSGHLSVSRAIKAGLAIHGFNDVEVIDFFELTMPRMNKLVNSFYMETLRRAPKLYGTFYDEINRIEQDSWLQKHFNRLGYDKLLNYLNSSNPSIVICTYPTPAGVIVRMRDKGEYNCFIATVVTDFEAHSQWINPGVDLYLVAHNGLINQLNDAGIDKEVLVVTGIPISPEFSQSPAARKEELGLFNEVPVILIMSGGSGMEKVAYEALDACMKLTQEIRAVMVCGNDARLKKELDEKFTGERKVKVVGFANNIFELMSKADLLITKPGGVTVSEALAKGLPMILYRPIPGQEEANARFIVNSGVGFLANDPRELEKYLNKALDIKISVQLKSAAESIAKPDAAHAAAKEIIKRFVG